MANEKVTEMKTAIKGIILSGFYGKESEDWMVEKIFNLINPRYPTQSDKTEAVHCEDEVEGIIKIFEEKQTHILHYHDKEGRTTEEQVIHKARYREIARTLIKAGFGRKPALAIRPQPQEVDEDAIKQIIDFELRPPSTMKMEISFDLLRDKIAKAICSTFGVPPAGKPALAIKWPEKTYCHNHPSNLDNCPYCHSSWSRNDTIDLCKQAVEEAVVLSLPVMREMLAKQAIEGKEK